MDGAVRHMRHPVAADVDDAPAGVSEAGVDPQQAVGGPLGQGVAAAAEDPGQPFAHEYGEPGHYPEDHRVFQHSTQHVDAPFKSCPWRR